jgi:hypothetical protein
MNSTIDLISTERDLLSQYTDAFNQKQTDVLAKYQTALDRLTASTQSENDETVALAQLQKQLDELSLTATLEKFTGIKEELAAKYQAYTSLVQDNNTLASTIFKSLDGTKSLVAQITTVVNEIDANISQINTTIDTYAAVTTSAPKEEATAAAPAPVAEAEPTTDA